MHSACSWLQAVTQSKRCHRGLLHMNLKSNTMPLEALMVMQGPFTGERSQVSPGKALSMQRLWLLHRMAIMNTIL